MPSVRRVFIATSLDGFIARLDGSIDWLDEANRSVPPGEDCGYADFMSGVDALVMGRHTFALARTFSPWPYEQKPVYVLSHSLAQLPADTPSSVILARGAPSEIVAIAAQRGHSSLYIDGGRTIQQFLKEGLISEIIITVVPVLLGSGRRLFGAISGDVKLRHIGTRSFSFGFVQSHYAVERAA